MPTFVERTFRFWQALGVHVVRNHYAQPIPDTRTLHDELWSTADDPAGVDFREQAQLELLERFRKNYHQEYAAFPRQTASEPFQYYVFNAQYESVDGEILYSMIREFKPARILEFGAGFTTLAMAQAIRKNMEENPAYRCCFESVDPEPEAVIKFAVPGLTKWTKGLAQDAPLSVFDQLGSNDVLFIDSSHVLKIGSDIHYLFLRVLPRLRPGVIVHVHDIFLPLEYPRDWIMRQHRFYNEQYLLQAFLTHNTAFDVLWGGAFMHQKHSHELARAIPSYQADQVYPGSFWMRRK